MRFDFLMCSERSGSNLVTQLLNAHSEVCGPFPSHLILRVSRHVWRYGDLRVDAHWDALLHDVADYLSAMHSTWSHPPDGRALAEGASSRDFGAVVRAAYRHLARREGKRRVFVKDNKAATNLAFIEAHFEGPRYVLVVRDPRDMAMTWRDNAVEPGGVQRAATCWLEDQTANLRAWSLLHPQGRIHLVRFEDLVTEPHAVLSALCDFLDLAFEPGMLAFHEQPLLRHNAAALSSWTDLARPLDPTMVGRYRGRLTAGEVAQVQALCGPLMPCFGYDLADPESMTGAPPDVAPPDPAELAIFARWYAVCERIASRTPPPLVSSD